MHYLFGFLCVCALGVVPLVGSSDTTGDGVGGDGGTEMVPFDCDTPAPANCPTAPPDSIDAERPADALVPTDYAPSARYPLVIVLHGLGSFGSANAIYLGAIQRVDSRQYILVTPDALEDVEGVRGWNADAIVLEFEPEPPDDRAYVRRLIAEAKRTYRIDEDRIYLMGTSNGGHLALDLICEDPTVVTAVLNQAGALPEDAPCDTGATSLLSVHGTDDETVAFGGGLRENGVTILSAVNLVAQFAARSGCAPVEVSANLDLVPDPPGAETRVQSYSGCLGGSESALWAVQQGPHVPDFTDAARDLWFDWLLASTRSQN
ncbi:MAG: alpha/beta hydrolase-fold protein [Myxococcales bacterium]|nr:alpha/beta hydrolase-fold protein [Myxococcales bacterium]